MKKMKELYSHWNKKLPNLLTSGRIPLNRKKRSIPSGKMAVVRKRRTESTPSLTAIWLSNPLMAAHLAYTNTGQYSRNTGVKIRSMIGVNWFLLIFNLQNRNVKLKDFLKYKIRWFLPRNFRWFVFDQFSFAIRLNFHSSIEVNWVLIDPRNLFSGHPWRNEMAFEMAYRWFGIFCML